VSETVDWDEPVSEEIATEWNIWKNTLKDIETLRIPRLFLNLVVPVRTVQLLQLELLHTIPSEEWNVP
jgi:hypothetical protein